MHWHLISSGETLETVDSRKEGLTANEAERRLVEYGRNELKEKTPD